MSLLNAGEIFQFAIRIEENGETFYRSMAEKFDNTNFRELFLTLADEEIRHKNIFSGMLSKLEPYEPTETYPGEYFEYLRAYAEKIIFNKPALEKEMTKIKEPLDAVEFALQREWESISYYNEIKMSVPEGQHNQVDKIISEERKHFARLSEGKQMFISA